MAFWCWTSWEITNRGVVSMYKEAKLDNSCKTFIGADSPNPARRDKVDNVPLITCSLEMSLPLELSMYSLKVSRAFGILSCIFKGIESMSAATLAFSRLEIYLLACRTYCSR